MTLRNTLMVSALLAPGAALAQDQATGFDVVVNADDEHLVTPMGVGLLIGGGSSNLLTDRGESAVRTGGSWHARGVLGTRSVVAGELAYIGSANRVVSDLPVSERTVLLSNGGELVARVQAPIGVGPTQDVLIEPFATAGMGMLVHDLVNTDVDLTNDGRFGDDITVHVPLGAGIAMLTRGFVADARLTYRPTINDTAIFGRRTRFDNAMDGLAVTGSIGIEF